MLTRLISWAKPLLRDVFSLSKLRPQTTAWYEFFLMRVLFSLALLDEISVIRLQLPFPKLGLGKLMVTEQPFPVGIAKLFNLSQLGDPAVFEPVKWAFIIALFIYCSGYALPMVLPVLAVIHLAIFTLMNSQGASHHIHQMSSLVLIAQAIVVWWPRAQGFSKLKALSPEWRSLVVFQSMVMVTACYVLAGISKLINSNGLWLWKSPYIAMGMHKSNEQRFYNYINPADRKADYLELAQYMFDHPFVTRIMLGGGFLVEAFAFLALRNRQWALAIGLGLMGMHLSITRFMGLHFKHNEYLVVIFLINVPFWIAVAARSLKKGSSGAL